MPFPFNPGNASPQRWATGRLEASICGFCASV